MRTRRSRGGRRRSKQSRPSKQSKRSKQSIASLRNADYPDLAQFLETHKQSELCALYEKLQIAHDGRIAYFLQQKDKTVLDLSFRLKNGLLEGWKLRTHSNPLKVAKIIDTYYTWDPSQPMKRPNDIHALDSKVLETIQRRLIRQFPLCRDPTVIEHANYSIRNIPPKNGRGRIEA